MKTAFAILIVSIIAFIPCLVTGTPVTIAGWTFENSPYPAGAGPYSPETGSGSASGSHAGTATYSSPAGNGSSHSFSAASWAVGDYWQFSVSTLSYQNIVLSWDQTGSGTGPRDFILQYSLNGISFAQIGSAYTVSLANWNATTFHNGYTFAPDLSGIASLIADKSEVYFRLVDNSTTPIGTTYLTVQSSGTDRVDNFIVSGDRIPSPVPDSLSEPLGLGFAVGLLAFYKTGNTPWTWVPERTRPGRC